MVNLVSMVPRPTVPAIAPSAGLQYTGMLHEVLAGCSDLTILSLATASVRTAVPDGGIPVGYRSSFAAPHSPLDRVLSGIGAAPSDRRRNAILGKLENAARRVDPTFPPLRLIFDIERSHSHRIALSRADVVDLQWTEFIRTASAVRRVAPSAQLVGTFHDVMSQLTHRRATSEAARRAELRHRLTVRAEKDALRRLDTVVTLNEKDAELLVDLGAEDPMIIDPPVLVNGVRPRQRTVAPTVVFVAAYGRAVNIEAARWLIEEVWPTVHRRRPDAHLRLVGGDPNGGARELCRDVPNAVATGYVDDLGDEYARAWTAVVPLRMGSGIKFKTLESMVSGVPTVSTRIGAEGITDAERLHAVHDEAHLFSQAVIESLESPDDADECAADLALHTRERYGVRAFTRRVREVYSIRDGQ